eukprot:COSAG03_NODE_288_length_9356_cov_6.131224_3_plen_116_part_00
MALARGHLARYIARGQGSKLIDIDGHEYTDLSLSHGAGVLGHDHPAIRAAVLEALSVGTVCSMDTRYHSPASRPRGGRPRRRRSARTRPGCCCCCQTQVGIISTVHGWWNTTGPS